MFLWSIYIAILSVIFIYVVHSLFLYFRDNLTNPKIKEYNNPQKKYEEIIDLLTTKTIPEREPRSSARTSGAGSIIGSTPIFDLPSTTATPMNSPMKDELKHFLKQQMQSIQPSPSPTTSISTTTMLDAFHNKQSDPMPMMIPVSSFDM